VHADIRVERGTDVTGRRLMRWAGTVLLLTTSWTGLAGAQVAGPLPTPLPLFPADHWWNTDISTAPVDQNSAAFIAFIDNNTNGGRRLRQDWGGPAMAPASPTASRTSLSPAASPACR
jgi:hypothetical protein